MGSEMFVFDEANYYPDEFSGSNFFTDPLSTLSDSSIDSLLQEISDDQNKNPQICTQISADEAQSLDQITHALFSDSPPSNQLETLSIQGQFGHFTHLTNSPNSLGNVYRGNNNNYCGFPEVKNEEFHNHLGFDYSSSQNNNNNNSYYFNCGGDTMLKFMQRSYSSNSFDGEPGFLPPPRFDPLLEVRNFNHISECSQIRRVCSTGDLPKVEMNPQTCTQAISSTSPMSGEDSNYNNNNNEENNYKVGRYSAEERKERIDRYRAKRTQRNFNKTIKVCLFILYLHILFLINFGVN
ncbi:hypothetical protein RND81_08G113100 [Saponaria officinalis]|uniref:Uncharacterized protein n=1 Tax=Saponaria officinalis TaxID=3572 RepID=A0AAW1J5I9_SAPOF